MSINGIHNADIPFGYETVKAGENISAGSESFLQKIVEKAAETVSGTSGMEYAEKAFRAVGSRAPQEVKQAWMDAAHETGVNGLGIGPNGMMTHISQMMVQRLNRNLTGRGADADDILGNSVSSALRAAGEALYDLEHPRSQENRRSLEVQYHRMKEREFYQAFIRNLEAIM